MKNAEMLREVSVDKMAILLDEYFSINKEYVNNYCRRCEEMHNGCPNEINHCCNRTSREMIIDLLEQKCMFIL